MHEIRMISFVKLIIMVKRKIKICLTCSAGGHLHQLQLATKGLIDVDYYWVMYPIQHARKFLENKKHYFIINLEFEKKTTYIINSVQSFFHLLLERPDVIISTGAGVSIPTLYLGKKLFKAKIIFICSAANVTEPSRTPNWAYKYSDLFLVQWDDLKGIFPNSINIGVL